MVKVTILGIVVLLVRLPEISPESPVGKPVTRTVLLLVQLKLVPAKLPLSIMGEIVLPEQIVCIGIDAMTSGI